MLFLCINIAYAQDDTNGSYWQAYNAGILAGIEKCKKDPVSCGIDQNTNSTIADEQTNDFCSTLEKDLTLLISCAKFADSRFGFKLIPYSNHDDPFGFYWQLDISSILEIIDNTEITDPDNTDPDETQPDETGIDHELTLSDTSYDFGTNYSYIDPDPWEFTVTTNDINSVWKLMPATDEWLKFEVTEGSLVEEEDEQNDGAIQIMGSATIKVSAIRDGLAAASYDSKIIIIGGDEKEYVIDVIIKVLSPGDELTFEVGARQGALVAGANHSVAMDKDGFLWAWGKNDAGELGTSSDYYDEDIPVKMDIDSKNDWLTIAAGRDFTMAIDSQGVLWACGSNDIGALGLDPTNDENRQIPILTPVGDDKDWQYVAAGDHFTLAIKQDNSLWAWGENWDGQLGVGSDAQYKLNASRVGSDEDKWIYVAAGTNYALGIKEDGSLWAWGDNWAGQLGIGDDTAADRNVPEQVGTDTDWACVFPGDSHTLALKSNGALYAWGNNYFGELGDGTTNRVHAPILIGYGWRSAAAGTYDSVGIKEDGTLWIWGQKPYCKLKDEMVIEEGYFAPVQVGTDTDWHTVVSGWDHSIAIKTDGTMWAWGCNEPSGAGAIQKGYIGDGTTITRYEPVQIGPDTEWKVKQ